MAKIELKKEDLTKIVDSIIMDQPNKTLITTDIRNKMLLDIEEIFWDCFLAPLNNSEVKDITLQDIYKYNNLKDIFRDRQVTKRTSLVLSQEDVKFIRKHFESYTHWNPQMYPIIIHADKILKELRDGTTSTES